MRVPAAYERVVPGFESAADVFRDLVASGREVGGAVCVYRDGVAVLEISGGTADAARLRPWSPETVVQVFSTGKPLAAYAALRAVRLGFVTLDDPVVTWWPEYVDHEDVPTTLRMILCHTAGKAVFSRTTASATPWERDALLADLAAQHPAVTPGSTLAEHAATYGHLIDGVLRGAGAPSVADATAELSDALGARLYFGVPDDYCGHVAEVEERDTEWAGPTRNPESMRRALVRPAGLLDEHVLRQRVWLRTSFPAVGLVTDALSLARFYHDVMRSDGVVAGLLGDDLRCALVTAAATGFDHMVRTDVSWSLGMRVSAEEVGMGGIGGSSAWFSLRHGYAMAYVTRGLAGHDRANAVADAVEAALAARAS